ncbi:YbhN family protein [Paracidovorax citrulli]|nr:YbhN family protein [Paracidovorax citrulli]ATG96600.1 lysylphosphatidylglycerol synthetase family protein [Paracidovorax citrulli]PVY64288.1 hypothetical protein C8E08_1601 [Paracidovorax citrulli]QCX10202.1 Inner membrane protein YbhN [Paracidovorax citrulli]REG71510.1 hypothetical protein C8E07_4766 [Paracidovorax citrulli]RLJ96063.1 hypothetical protein C8E06_4761 [Paracidovorax citrulli]
MPAASPTPALPQDHADGAGSSGEKKSRWQRLRSQRWWPWAMTLVTGAFIVFVITLLVRQARNVDWGAVWEAFLALPTPTLLTAAALALASHGLYSTFDLFGRHFTRHGLSVGRTVGITLIAYPFTLNLGSIIGGVSVRYRLYSRQGVPVGAIGQVIGQSIVTNWLGYFVLAGAVFWAWSPQLPQDWHVGPQELRWAGTALAAVTVAYVVACAVRHGRPIAWRGHDFPLPGWRVALLQVVVSTANWMVMGAAVWVLAGRDTPYAAALATVLLGAVAGLVSRIPAGLGVLEAVGTAVLSAYIPTSQALAAVLAYRALYFFAPLVLAALAFGAVEWFGRGTPPKAEAGAEDESPSGRSSGKAPGKAAA